MMIILASGSPRRRALLHDLGEMFAGIQERTLWP